MDINFIIFIHYFVQHAYSFAVNIISTMEQTHFVLDVNKNDDDSLAKIRSLIVKISENGYRGVRYSLITIKSLSLIARNLFIKLLKAKKIIKFYSHVVHF